MRQCLALLALMALAPAASADDVLNGWTRFGATYHRIDMDGGTHQACSALCDRDGQCRAWVFVPAGLEGPDARCEFLSATPTPRRHPGRMTGLASDLVAQIEAAADRPPTERERDALRANLPEIRRHRQNP